MENCYNLTINYAMKIKQTPLHLREKKLKILHVIRKELQKNTEYLTQYFNQTCNKMLCRNYQFVAVEGIVAIAVGAILMLGCAVWLFSKAHQMWQASKTPQELEEEAKRKKERQEKKAKEQQEKQAKKNKLTNGENVEENKEKLDQINKSFENSKSLDDVITNMQNIDKKHDLQKPEENNNDLQKPEENNNEVEGQNNIDEQPNSTSSPEKTTPTIDNTNSNNIDPSADGLNEENTKSENEKNTKELIGTETINKAKKQSLGHV